MLYCYCRHFILFRDCGISVEIDFISIFQEQHVQLEGTGFGTAIPKQSEIM